jgi:hypothetical protein
VVVTSDLAGLDVELDGFVSGATHGSHPDGKLASEQLLECMEDLAIEVEREQGVEDLNGIPNILSKSKP